MNSRVSFSASHTATMGRFDDLWLLLTTTTALDLRIYRQVIISEIVCDQFLCLAKQTSQLGATIITNNTTTINTTTT